MKTYIIDEFERPRFYKNVCRRLPVLSGCQKLVVQKDTHEVAGGIKDGDIVVLDWVKARLMVINA